MTGLGHNADTTVAKRWIGEILRIEAELLESKADYDDRRRDIMDRRKDVIKSAKNAGVNVKAIAASLRIKKAEEAFARVIQKATPTDDEDRYEFEQITEIVPPGPLFEFAYTKQERARADAVVGLPGADNADA